MVVGKLAQAAAWRTELEQEARKLAVARVAAAREEARRTDEVVERRLVESLTGVTAEEARRLNIVPPGEKTEEMVWGTATRAIAKVNDQPAVTGYLVLTPEEAERFRDNGGWRTDIAAAEIEPYLYRTHAKRRRRHVPHPQRSGRGDVPRPRQHDPLAISRDDRLAGRIIGGGGSPEWHESPTPNEQLEGPATFVGRLINGMRRPRSGRSRWARVGLTDRGRPNAEDVQREHRRTGIASGPADVTAFHDYHNLQIAFDYVWKQFARRWRCRDRQSASAGDRGRTAAIRWPRLRAATTHRGDEARNAVHRADELSI